MRQKGAGSDGFDLSNHYNIVLDHMEHQAALGWNVTTGTDQNGHPLLVLADRSGGALSGAIIDAAAERPVGDRRATAVSFAEVSQGHYVGDAALDTRGQWDLRLSVTVRGEMFVTTRRIVVH